MAARFWIASTTSTWNSTANWASTSGGSGPVSVPGVSDDVTFDGSGLGSCTVDADISVNSITWAVGYAKSGGTTGTFDNSANHTVTTVGAFAWNAAATAVYTGGTGAKTIGGNCNFTPAVATTIPVTLAGTWTIAGNFTFLDSASYFPATSTVVSGATITMTGSGKTYSALVASLTTFNAINFNGTTTVPLVGSNTGVLATTITINGTLTNNETGTNGGLNVANAGTMTVGASGVYAGTGKSTFNNGTIAVNVTSGGTWTNTGAVTVANNLTITVSSVTLSGAWTFSNGATSSKTVSFNGTNLTFGGAVVFDINGNSAWNLTNNITGITGFAGGLAFTNTTGSGSITYTRSSGTLKLLVGSLVAQETVTLSNLTFEDVLVVGNKAVGVAAGATFKSLTHTGGNLTITGTTLTVTNNVSLSATTSSVFDSTGLTTMSIGGSLDSSAATTTSMTGTTYTFTGTGGSIITNSTGLGIVSFTGSSTYSIGSAGAVFGSTTVGGSAALTASNALSFTGDLTLTGTLAGTGALTFTNGPTITNNGTWNHTGTIAVAKGGTITGSGSTLTWANNFTFTQGSGAVTLNFSKNMVFNGTATFNQDVASSSTSYTINDHDNNITFNNSVTLSETTSGKLLWTKGSGTITLSGSGNQSINFGGKTVEDIVIASTGGTVSFTGVVITDSFTVNSGTVAFSANFTTNGAFLVNAGAINFGGKDFTIIGNFTIVAGATVVGTSLNGSEITIGGNFVVAGVLGTLLDLGATNTWFLTVNGTTATASYVQVSNCDASGGILIVADANSVLLSIIAAGDLVGSVDPLPGVDLVVDITTVANVVNWSFNGVVSNTSALNFYGKLSTASSYSLVGSAYNLRSGSVVTFVWLDRQQHARYNWYATIGVTSTAVKTFSTADPVSAVDATEYRCLKPNGQVAQLKSRLFYPSCDTRTNSLCTGSPAYVPAITVCNQRLY